MIGVFDSGVGGFTAIAELRRLAPSVDICFLQDRKNSPYGTKSKEELTELVIKDAELLKAVGADKILMACCTASTVHSSLPHELSDLCQPIIEPAAREAAHITENGRISVIATDATVRSGAFRDALLKHGSVKEVSELATQNLVAIVESGVTDRTVTEAWRREIFRLISPIKKAKSDTLILGCTHFPHLEITIGGMLPGVKLVNPSREGAKEIMKNTSAFGKGETVYL